MTTLEELEVRVAALEAKQVDYTAVMTAVNALSVQTGERFAVVNDQLLDLRTDVRDLKTGQAELKNGLADTNARVRSIEEGMSEMKDLLVEALGSKKKDKK